jgi:hypothetical protein
VTDIVLGVERHESLVFCEVQFSLDVQNSFFDPDCCDPSLSSG